MTAIDLEVADCLQVLPALRARSVDLVVTSPPYNLGIRYSRFDDRQSRSAYLEWCTEWGGQLARILREKGSLFLNIGASPSNPMLPHEIVLQFRGLFVLQNTIHWIKSIAIDECSSRAVRDRGRGGEDTQCGAGRSAGATGRTFGHFKPINSPRYLNDCHEYIFHLTKSGDVELDRLALGVPYQDKSNIARWGHTEGRDLRCRGNTWYIPYQTIKSRDKQRPHPATFPVELAENCIRLHGISRVKTMLDPFVGIGNSALAAIRCGVPKFIGFDVDQTYVAEAKRRVAASAVTAALRA